MNHQERWVGYAAFHSFHWNRPSAVPALMLTERSLSIQLYEKMVTHTLIKEQGPQLENLLKYSLKDTHSVYFKNSNIFPLAAVSSLAFTCDSCYPGLSYTDVPGWVCPPWHFSFGTLAFDILEDWKQNYNNLASMQQWKQRRTRDHGCCRQPNWVLVFPAVIQPPAHWQLGFSLGSGGDLVASSAMAVSRYSCSFFPCHLYSHICRYKQNKA